MRRILLMKKRYWALLALLVVIALDAWLRMPDARSRQLTAALEAQASPEMKAYPYHFHVMKFQGDTAWLSTPRNVDVPAARAIAAMFPEVDTHNPDNPAFIAAQQRLGEVQGQARAIVLSQSGVAQVRWELDRDWLTAHAIDVPTH